MKKRHIYLLLILALIIIAFAVTIQFFRSSNDIAEWLFNFVNEWAPVLSATAAVTLIITFLWNLRENRRERARRAIYNWVKDAMKMTVSSQNILNYLHSISNAGTLLYDADSLGKSFRGELTASIEAIEKYCNLLGSKADKGKLRKQAKIIFDRLGELSEHILND